MSSHARVAPSSLWLTVACNYSLPLQETVPPLPPTDEEAEGTAAHWVARRYIAGYGHELPAGAKFHSEGREWTVTDDMFSGAKLYERALGGVHPDLRIEEHVTVPRVHELCDGTPDASRFYLDAREAWEVCPENVPLDRFTYGHIRVLRVGDYKFGHRYVDAFENFQLGAGYASGLMDRHRLNDSDPDLYVEVIIVQPRNYHPDGHVRRWIVRAIDLRPLVNIAYNAAHAALGALPTARTGDHCLDCKARHACKVLQVNTAHLADFSQTGERVELPAWAIGQELTIVRDAIKRLEARETGLAAQAESYLRAGQAVPFYHMEPGRTVLTYFDDVRADELVGLGDLVNIELRRTLALKDKIVTPTQAIQLGIDEAVMSSYAHRPRGKLKLARDNSVTARKVFLKP